MGHRLDLIQDLYFETIKLKNFRNRKKNKNNDVLSFAPKLCENLFYKELNAHAFIVKYLYLLWAAVSGYTWDSRFG